MGLQSNYLNFSFTTFCDNYLLKVKLLLLMCLLMLNLHVDNNFLSANTYALLALLRHHTGKGEIYAPRSEIQLRMVSSRTMASLTTTASDYETAALPLHHTPILSAVFMFKRLRLWFVKQCIKSTHVKRLAGKNIQSEATQLFCLIHFHVRNITAFSSIPESLRAGSYLGSALVFAQFDKNVIFSRSNKMLV